MKVVCVSNDYYIDKKNLTIGKEYECISIDHNDIKYWSDLYYCMIIDNNNKEMMYPKFFFVTVEEYRNRKLEDIGI